VILLVQNYVEVVFWFAFFYRTFSYLFAPGAVSLDSFWGAIYYSLRTMTTFGGDLTPNQTGGVILIVAHTAVALIMVILVLASFVSYVPKPETLDRTERSVE